MTDMKPFYSLAHISIQLCSPMLIASSQAIDGFDANFIRDANELPMIPGTSIAGVLSHLVAEDDDLAELLGNSELRSALQVSAAVVHNSKNEICEGLINNSSEDTLLSFLQQKEPLSRDRVALNERGVSVEGGKYDFVAVPAGTRFTFALKLQTHFEHKQQWQKLLNLLYQPQFRLGQKIRSGLGQLKIIQCYCFTADLTKEEDRERFTRLTKRLTDTDKMSPYIKTDLLPEKQLDYKEYFLDVKAENGLRIGQGRHSFGSEKADALIWSEPCIYWQNNKAIINNYQRVIPASSIKGALLHRTLFHYRRLNKLFVKETVSPVAAPAEQLKLPAELQLLFGTVQDDNDSAIAGRIMIDDVYLYKEDELEVMSYQHNSIDRFSGGTRNHVLFSEEVLWQAHFKIVIRLDQKQAIAQTCITAFECSLNDLITGGLALGAGANKGHGYLKGKIL